METKTTEKKLTKVTPVDGTPFAIVELKVQNIENDKDGNEIVLDENNTYVVVLGQHRALAEDFGSYEEAEARINEKPWELIFSTVAILMEDLKNNKHE